MIPKKGGERVVDTRKDGDEMGFEGADGAFCGVATMYVGRYELVLCLPFLSNFLAVGGADLVAQDLEVD